MKLGDLDYGCHFIDRHGLVWVKMLESRDLATHSACICVSTNGVSTVCGHTDFRLDDSSLIYYYDQRLERGGKLLLPNELDISQIETDYWHLDPNFLAQ